VLHLSATYINLTIILYVQCNTTAAAKKLSIVGKRSGAVFPFDVPLKLLEPELSSGDTVAMVYM
jgi:hypothetical protein